MRVLQISQELSYNFRKLFGIEPINLFEGLEELQWLEPPDSPLIGMEATHDLHDFILNTDSLASKIDGKWAITMKILLFECHPVEVIILLQLLYSKYLAISHFWKYYTHLQSILGAQLLQQLQFVIPPMLQEKQQHTKSIQHTLSKINYLGLQALEASLSDHSTCHAFIEAISNNHHEIHGRIVLHLTTGCNCLYSIYAAQMGAKKVFCVINGHGEIQRKNKYMMQEIVKENQWEHIVEVLFFKDFNEQVDVIIGEPMGYNLIYDGLLDRMIQARDLHVNDLNKCLILPNKVRFKCAFIRDEHFIDKKVEFWDKVYGIPMCSMKNWISHQPMVRLVDPSLIVSETTKFIDFDIKNVAYEQIDNIKTKFNIKTPMDVMANGITIWFELLFKKSDGQAIEVKASPWCQSTKWTQMTLYGKNMWQLDAGGHKTVEFSGKKNHIEGSVVMRLRVDNGDEEVYHFS